MPSSVKMITRGTQQHEGEKASDHDLVSYTESSPTLIKGEPGDHLAHDLPGAKGVQRQTELRWDMRCLLKAGAHVDTPI